MQTGQYSDNNAGNWDESWFAGGWGGPGRQAGTVVLDSPTCNFGNNWGGPFSGGCLFLLADGSVRSVAFGFDVTNALKPNDGSVNPLP